MWWWKAPAASEKHFPRTAFTREGINFKPPWICSSKFVSSFHFCWLPSEGLLAAGKWFGVPLEIPFHHAAVWVGLDDEYLMRSIKHKLMVIIFKLSWSTHNYFDDLLLRINRCFCLKAYLLVRRTNQLTIPTRESFLQRKERDAFIQFIISITSFPKRTHHPFSFLGSRTEPANTTHMKRAYAHDWNRIWESQTVFVFRWKLNRPPTQEWRNEIMKVH